MRRVCIICLTALAASFCTAETIEVSTDVQAGSNIQGTQLGGIQLQGTVQNMSMVGFQYTGATLNAAPLVNLHIDKGELVAEQNQVTLHSAALRNAYLIAQVQNGTNPPTTSTVQYQITAVDAEVGYDPTHSGSTYLYSLSQNVDGTGWQPACGADLDGRHVAIPIAATWDSHGNRVESSTLFTFGCTTGVIAKCYRWGYRPWVTGYGNLVTTHQICTRAARADYCGNGTSHTHDGTLINIWDAIGAPGPIQSHGQTPLGMLFEAGWNTTGAVCLSHARWLLGGPIILLGCPDRLLAPGLGVLGATVCDTIAEVLGQNASAQLFDESYLNLNLDVL